MEQKKEQDLCKKLEIFLFLATLIVFGAIFAVFHMGIPRQSEEQAELLSDGWYYMKDGIRQEISLPAEIPAEKGETLILYNDSLGKEAAGKLLITTGAQYDLAIRLNGRLLYEYKEVMFARNVQMKSKLDCIATLGNDTDGKTLTLSYHTPQQGKYIIKPVYIGSGRATVLYQLKKELMPLGAAVIMIVLSVIALFASFYMKKRKMSGGRFQDVALFLVICSIWLITDSSLAQSYSNCPEALCLISFYMFMLLAVPMIHFQQKLGNMRKYRILNVGIFMFYCNALVQGILAFMGIAKFKDMLFVTHILLLVWVVILAALLIREYRTHRRKEFLILLSAYIIVGASGVLALGLYWLFEISYYGVIFEMGSLAFMILILADAVMEVADNIRYRMEAQAYERLVQRDGMTGLETRNGFEKALEEISANVEKYKDILLVYIDIDHLRLTNEEFGRGKGDELVVASARCIENVFREKGSCYRIGGDEFAVLVCDPGQQEEFWKEKLTKEIAGNSRGTRFRISLSWGSCNLRNPDGTWKTIGEWKYEADQKLYENKKKKEEQENGVY